MSSFKSSPIEFSLEFIKSLLDAPDNPFTFIDDFFLLSVDTGEFLLGEKKRLPSKPFQMCHLFLHWNKDEIHHSNWIYVDCDGKLMRIEPHGIRKDCNSPEIDRALGNPSLLFSEDFQTMLFSKRLPICHSVSTFYASQVIRHKGLKFKPTLPLVSDFLAHDSRVRKVGSFLETRKRKRKSARILMKRS